jgi:hypothetical protein
VGEQINAKLIKLIPKGRKNDMVGGWRPFNLFNVSYNALAKVLAKRIKITTARIVQLEQMEFIQGYFILDNVIIAWESIWA